MASATDSVMEPYTSGRIALRPRVTVNELAVAVRIHPETVRRYYREGRISGARVGQTITFSAEDVAAFLSDLGITNVVLLDSA